MSASHGDSNTPPTNTGLGRLSRIFRPTAVVRIEAEDKSKARESDKDKVSKRATVASGEAERHIEGNRAASTSVPNVTKRNGALVNFANISEAATETEAASPRTSAYSTAGSAASVEAFKGIGDDFDLVRFVTTCKAVHAKAIEALPVYKDIARLMKGLIVNDERSNTILLKYRAEGDDGFDRFSIVRQLLTVLSKALLGVESTGLVSWVNQNFPDVHNFENSMQKFLSEFDKQPNSFKVVQVLKCIHQEMPVAAVAAMKQRIGSKAPYKDVRGTWHIEITIGEASIIVTHKKTEQSQSNYLVSSSSGNHLPGSTPYLSRVLQFADIAYFIQSRPVEDENPEFFKFDWVLSLEFSPDMSVFTPLIQIVDYEFSKKMLSERQNEIVALFQPFLDKKISYVRQFKKPLKKLSIHRDISKFINKISVVDGLGRKLWQSSSSLDLERNILSFLVFIAEKVDVETRDASLKKIRDFFARPEFTTSDQLLNGSEDGLDSVPLISVLKLFSMDMVYPALLTMRENIYQKGLPFIDVRGSWHQHLQFLENKTVLLLTDYRHICTSVECYQFVLQNYEALADFDFRIVDYGFNETTPVDCKSMLKEALKRYYQPKNAVIDVDNVDQLLGMIIDRLAFETKPLQVYHQDFPHSVPVVNLLSQIRAKLLSANPEVSSGRLSSFVSSTAAAVATNEGISLRRSSSSNPPTRFLKTNPASKPFDSPPPTKAPPPIPQANSLPSIKPEDLPSLQNLATIPAVAKSAPSPPESTLVSPRVRSPRSPRNRENAGVNNDFAPLAGIVPPARPLTDPDVEVKTLEGSKRTFKKSRSGNFSEIPSGSPREASSSPLSTIKESPASTAPYSKPLPVPPELTRKELILKRTVEHLPPADPIELPATVPVGPPPHQSPASAPHTSASPATSSPRSILSSFPPSTSLPPSFSPVSAPPHPVSPTPVSPPPLPAAPPPASQPVPIPHRNSISRMEEKIQANSANSSSSSPGALLNNSNTPSISPASSLTGALASNQSAATPKPRATTITTQPTLRYAPLLED